MALALALVAIVVIGALVTGSFFAGRVEMQSGRNTVYAMQALEAAEAGLAAAFSPWDRNWNGYNVGVDQPQPPVAIPGPTRVRYTNTVRRLQGGVYIVSSVGQKLSAGGAVLAERRLARIGKLMPAGTASVDAAITAKDVVTVAGNSIVDGHDAEPTGWAGSCGPLSDVAGVRTAETVTVNGTPIIDGVPPMVQNDTTISDATFQQPFYAWLGSRTSTVTASNPPATWPTTAGGVCETSNPYNWGEPRRGAGSVPECQGYYPVVFYGAGTLKLQGGVGQGVLLVAGDLWLAGGVEFTGLIIVLGEVKTTGNGNKITGAVLSNNFNGDESSFGGTPTVQYSSCAIAAALSGTSAATPLGHRPWAQLLPR
jgi:hypothetical protein